MSKKLATPSVLAFERNLDISDAIFAQKTVKMTKMRLCLCVFEKNRCEARSLIV